MHLLASMHPNVREERYLSGLVEGLASDQPQSVRQSRLHTLTCFGALCRSTLFRKNSGITPCWTGWKWTESQEGYDYLCGSTEVALGIRSWGRCCVYDWPMLNQGFSDEEKPHDNCREADNTFYRLKLYSMEEERAYGRRYGDGTHHVED